MQFNKVLLHSFLAQNIEKILRLDKGISIKPNLR